MPSTHEGRPPHSGPPEARGVPGSRSGWSANRAAQPLRPSLSLLSPLVAGPFPLSPLVLVAPFPCPSPMGVVLLLAGHQ